MNTDSKNLKTTLVRTIAKILYTIMTSNGLMCCPYLFFLLLTIPILSISLTLTLCAITPTFTMTLTFINLTSLTFSLMFSLSVSSMPLAFCGLALTISLKTITSKCNSSSDITGQDWENIVRNTTPCDTFNMISEALIGLI